MKRVILIGVIAILACSHGLMAQDDQRFYEVVGYNGKRLGKINGIGQDPKGYMWFLSQDERCIYRYDGSRWITYKQDNVNPNALGTNGLETLYADAVGGVWIGGDGLDQFNIATGKFTHFKIDKSDPGSLAGGVSAILRDSKGRVWLGTNNGLDLLDEKTGKFTHHKHDPSNPNSISDNVVQSIYEDHQGTIWIGTGAPFFHKDPDKGGLNRLNEDGTFTRYINDPNNPNSLINNKVRSIFEDSRGVFWVGTSGDGLHTMDRKTGRVTRHRYDPAHPDKLSRTPQLKDDWHNYNDQITFITEDHAGRIWIGSMWTGINRYDTTTKKVTTFVGSHGFPDSTTWVANMSREGVLWVATLDNRLYRVDPSRKKIATEHLRWPANRFLEDKNGSLWIATDGGLLERDSAAKQFQAFSVPSQSGVNSVFEFNEDTLWIGTKEKLFGFDKKTRQFFIPLSGEQFDNVKWVNNCARDPDGWIWISTWLDGIFRYDPKTRFIKQYLPDPGDSDFFGPNHFNRVVFDKSGVAWSGSMKGILRWNRQTDDFKVYLPSLKIVYLFVDGAGDIWAGTSNGLFRYYKNEDKFDHFFDVQSEMASHSVYGIVEDNDRNLWVHTTSRVAMINPERNDHLVYGEQFGIAVNNLQIGAIHKSSKGEIFIGQDEGYYKFFPKRLLTIRNVDIHITDLFINSHSAAQGAAVLNKPVEDIDQLKLTFDQNNLAFNYSVVDYDMPEITRYYTRLEGYNDTWREDEGGRTSYYYNIPPGDYVYHIRAYSSAGIKAEKILSIYIAPPWWNTNAAYAGYGLLVVGLLMAGRRAIIQRERLKSNLKLQQIEREKDHIQLEKAKEVDRIKTSFFTNISHEFRTPLTLIKGPAQNLLEEFSNRPKVKAQLESIQNNADHLLKLINQLLDLAKLETGNVALKNTPVELNGFLRAVIHSFSSAALLKGIDIIPDLPLKSYKVSLDEDKVETILNNLIGNALKFTPRNGRVIVKTVVTDVMADGSRKLIVTVSDTGIGISAEHHSRIFDRFYQVNDGDAHKEVGTGIGLSLVRELTSLMGGNVSVESEPGQGTTFRVEIRVENVDALPGRHVDESVDVLMGGRVDVGNGNGKEEFIENGNGVSVKPRILVVEDHADLRQFIISSLGMDYDFLEAGDGAAGLETAIREIPDMIISDVMMPVMDGIVMTGKVRHDARTRHIPVIILTAKAGDENKLQGLDMGADDYLTKPFNKKELVVKVRNGIESRNRVREKVRLELLKEAPVIEVVSGDEQFLTQVRETILRRLSDEQLSVDSLAKEIGWSRAQFYRKVTALTGQPVNELIRSFRLNKAAQLLGSKWGPVSQVAFEVGFSNPSYFSKCFKEEFGVLPSEYVGGQ